MSRAIRMRWRLIAANVALALASLDARAQQTISATALPTGGRLAGGQATISQSGSAMSIVQGTSRAVLDWQSFNIGANASVVFSQPSANAVALNRVLGGNPSQIFGRLSSNGQVFLTNPSGILFGRGAQVDVGGILATTLVMSTDDFMAGHYLLRGDGTNSSILNEGTLRSAPKGYVALIAPVVQNTGVIDATSGTAALVAANAATVDFMADGLIQIKVDQGAINAEITNNGAIRADGGTVFLTANALDSLARSVVNNSGVIEARAVDNVKGVIRLSGGEVNLLPTSSISAEGGGQIEVQGGTLLADGRIDASNSRGIGGTIMLLGDKVGLIGNARVDASGDAGGGTVLVGGDFHGATPDIQNAQRTYVGIGATINADAITQGDGGKVAVWADGDTYFYGSISARGGALGGNGGFVETSAGRFLNVLGAVDTRAPLGFAGMWLLDPTSITIQAGIGAFTSLSQVDQVGDSDIGANTIAASVINSAGGNVTLAASGAIIFNAPVSMTTAGVGLTAQTQTGDITVNSGITTAASAVSGLASGSVNLTSNSGNIAINSNIVIGNATVANAAGTTTATSGGVTLSALGGSITGNGLLTTGNASLTGTTAAVRNSTDTATSGSISITAGSGGANLGGANALTVGTSNVAASQGVATVGNITLSSGGAINAGGSPLQVKFGAPTSGGNAATRVTGKLGAGTSAAGAGIFVASPSASLELSTISANGNVVVQGSTDLTFSGAVSVTGTGSRFTAQAGRNVTVNAALTTNNGKINLEADSPDALGNIPDKIGQLTITAPVSSNGGAITLIAGGNAGTSNSITGPDGNVNNVADNSGFRPIAIVDAGAGGINLALSRSTDELGIGVTGSITQILGNGVTTPGFGSISNLRTTGPMVIGKATTAGTDGLGTGAQILTVNRISNTYNNSYIALTPIVAGTFELVAGGGGILLDQPLTTYQPTTITTTGTVTISDPINTSGFSLTLPASVTISANGSINTGGGACSGTGCPVTDIFWDGGGGADKSWFNALNWSTDTVPGLTNNVTIASGSGAVLIASGSTALAKSLIANSDVSISAGALQLANASQFSGQFTLTGGSLTGTGSAAVTGAGGSLVWSGGTLASGGTFLLGGGNSGTLSNALTLNRVFENQGALTLSSATVGGTGSIVNSGLLTAASGTSNTINTLLQNVVLPTIGTIQVSGAGSTLTANSFSTNDGNIVVTNGGSFSTGANALTNSATSSLLVNAGNYTAGGVTVATAGGNLAVGGALSAGTVTLQSGGNMTLNAGSSVTATGTSDDAIVIAGANFINNSGSTALLPGAGRWLVYSTDPAGNTFGLLASGNTAIWGQSYPTAIADAGNRYVFANNGAVTVTTTNASKTYGDASIDLSAKYTLSGKPVDAATYENVYLNSTELDIFATGPTVASTGNTAIANAGPYSITGTGTANTGYSLTLTNSGQLTVDRRALAVSGATVDATKTYDGNANALNPLVTFGNAIVGDAVTATVSSATYNAGKNVQTGGATTVVYQGTAGLTGAQATNYTLVAGSTAGNVADITARALAVSGATVDATKTYDGNANALNPLVTFGNAIVGDAVTATVSSATYNAGKNVQTGGATTVVYQGTAGLTGAQATNYTLVAGSTAGNVADITARALAVSGATVDATKTYDGNANALNPLVTFGNAIVGDAVTATVSSATYNAGKNVQTGGATTVVYQGTAGLTGAQATNYTLVAGSTAGNVADITARALAVSGATVDATKTYDGNANALNPLVTFGNAIVGDAVTATVSSATYNAGKNVQTGGATTVVYQGTAGLTGAQATNYTLVAGSTAGNVADITARALAVSGATVDATKTYDGNANALNPLVTFGNAIVGDAVTATVSSATYNAGKNVQTGGATTVVYQGTAGLTGAQATNYTLVAGSTAGNVADITARALAVSGATVDATKTYDGNANALNPLVTFGNAIVGDAVTATVSSATYNAGKNVQTGGATTVVYQGTAGLTGAQATNYTLVAGSTAGNVADITARALAVSGATVDATKTYDGNANALNPLVTFGNAIVGDAVTATVSSATYNAGKNVQTGGATTVVYQGTAGLTGAQATNYTLVAGSTAGNVADITARALAVSGATVDATKTYDGNANALNPLVTFGNAIVGDAVTATVSSATYNAGKNVQTGGATTVVYQGTAGLTGAQATNYTLVAGSTAGNVADITARALAVSGATVDATKTYDGNANALNPLVTFGNAIVGDAVTATVSSATYNAGKNVQTGGATTVVYQGTAGLTGAQATNYTLVAGSTAGNVADITARALAVSGATVDATKTYDGNANALNPLVTFGNAIVGDAVTATVSSATYNAGKNVQTGGATTVVYQGTAGLTGAQATNYTLVAGSTAGNVADITARALAVSGATVDATKTYDGNANALNPLVTFGNAIVGDAVTATVSSATYNAGKNVQTGGATTVVYQGTAGLTGAQATNYTLVAGSTAGNVADITARALAVSAVTDSRQYNGTTNSVGTPTVTSGTVVVGDGLVVSQAFASKNVLGLNGSTLIPSFTLSDGNGGNNYVVTPVNATGTITAAPLTVSAVTDSRQYNGTTSSAGTPTVTSGTVFAGDSLAVSQAYSSKNVLGVNGSTLIPSFGLNDGNGGNNYAVTPVNALGTISSAALTIAPSNVTLNFGASVPTADTFTVVSGSVGAGDQLAASVSVGTTATSTSPAGTYSLTPGSVQFLQGSGSNYDITYQTGTLTIIATQPPPVVASIASAVSAATVASSSAASFSTSLQPSASTPVFATSTTPSPTTAVNALPATGSTSTGSSGGGQSSGNQGTQQASTAQSGIAAGSAAAAAVASAQLVSSMVELHARKLNAVGKAVKLLEQDPDIADLLPCSGQVSDDCIAVRPAGGSSGRGQQRVAEHSYAPGVERKVALLIGVGDYQGGIPKLSSPAKDVEEIGKIMKDKFGYEVRTVLNADKARIVHELNRLILESNDDDSIAIMYAGHGHLVEKTQRGYWIPSKASPDDPKQWISNQDIARALGNISAKQIFLVSDSCYSGTLTHEAKIDRTDIPPDPQAVLGRRSVTALSSGGDEPVADEGKDGHSVFAWHLMEQLKAVKDVSLGVGVYEQIAESVKAEIPQTPQYGASPSSGHQRGGDYLFEIRPYRQ